jgi:hypothetical protein
MQFPCLDCGKTLRVGDHHANPRVRCPNCGCVFRPLESALAQADPAENRASAADRRTGSLPSKPKTPSPGGRPQQPRTKNFTGMIGLGFMLLVMLGPRVAKIFQREPEELPAVREVEPEHVDRDFLRRLERVPAREKDPEEEDDPEDQPAP